jgi:hypothetical protein
LVRLEIAAVTTAILKSYAVCFGALALSQQ